ncbi:hypothetical protein TR13x_04540 [Caloranaerobacter sp. TR13]|uniref:S-layer homology domain-containing protein n=1 Tax=Caloranaerobacter sp. TR13 TaxID=1302151 RepID=UPI0006D3DCD0|nr:S-layer homology domain-containing protein [Caloranaerobacter sp. TR13]KPU27355.1 hypothetical protein TR13x_04540 [Caloranaerobacter sp. TR13]
MKKHISFLLVFSLVIGMFMPMTVVNAQGTDPNIILYETIRDSIIGQSLQNTDVDSLILVDSIRTLQGTGFLSGLINDITNVLNSNENNIAFKNFLKDNYEIDKANVDKLINILRDWSDVNSNDEDIFLKLFTRLKQGQDLDPVNDKDVLDYIAALRETVTTEMSNVITKWNNEVLLDSNRKTEFALEVIGKILSNINAEKDSQGNLVFSLTSDTNKLDQDLINIENEFLNDVVPRLSTQSFSYVDAINDCIPVLNQAVQEVIDTTSLSVDDMVNLIQALGINYIDNQESISIEAVYHRHLTDLEIVLSDVPSERPTALSVDVTRTINGVLDTDFQWNGGMSSWDENTRTLTINELELVPGAEYSVTYKDTESGITIENLTQINYTNLDIIFSDVPSEVPTALSVDLTRVVDGVVDTSFEWNGGMSSFNAGTKTLTIYRIPYVENAVEGQTVVYGVSYKGSEPVYSQPVSDQGSSVSLESVSYKNLTDLEIILSDVPSERPTALSVDVTRTINGVLDTSFAWNGGMSSWDAANRKLSIYGIDSVEGAKYSVTYKDTASGISVESVTQNDYNAIEIVFTGIPSEEPTATSVDITRTINGVLDTSFAWNGGTSVWFDFIKTLRIINIPLPEPTSVDQSVVYSITYNGVTMDTEPILVKAAVSSNPPSSGTTKPKDSSSDDTDKSEETLVEVNVPEDPEEPVTGTVGEESTTVEVKDGMTKVSVKEETIVSAIEDIVNAVKESEDERKAQLVLELANTEDLNLSVSLPSQAITKLLENNVDLIIKSDDIEYNIPADMLDSKDIPEDAVVEIKSKELSEDEVKTIKETAQKEGNIAKVLDFSLEVNTEKEVKSLTKFNNYIVIKINVDGLGDKDKLGIYYLNEETNELEFIGGKIKDGKLIMKTNHFSKYAVIESNKQFADTVKHWSKYYVESMAAKHVVDGYPDGTFMPEKKITRAEFAKIVVKALELDLVKYTDGFSDVTSDAWYADYIATAKAAGLVEGYEDGTFKPNQEITRLEMAALLSRAVKDVELTEDDIEAILKAYADNDEIQKWGRGYAAKVIKAELMIGVTHNTFVPNGKTTRAEAATAIYRLYNR